ncbi:MAG: TRAP transporter permease [Litorivicinaceae bacterium]
MVSRQHLIVALGTLISMLCIAWNVNVPSYFGVAYLTEQYMALQLGLALAILFLLSATGSRVRITGHLMAAAIVVSVLGYAAWQFDELLAEQAYRPWIITLIGAVVTVSVMEGIRRQSGWPLFSIIAIFLIYALFAGDVPGPLIGRELTVSRLVEYVGFDPSAVFSTPLAVGTTIVVLFVLFGNLLFAAGGGAFFTDLAMAVAGKSRGGSAKIAVLASALFGSISGSAVSNVVTTGVVTIPLMERSGYSKRDSGAIEAIASTGGQLSPPIMGAAAFLMAEFLEISYMAVAAAALVPAVLYYYSVYVQIDLIARRDAIRAADVSELRLGDVLREGWHFLIPFAVLLWGLFGYGMDPEDAAILASLPIIGLGFVRGYRTHRLTMRQFFDVFSQTGLAMVDLILVVAAAGFVIGVLNTTGLGFALTLLLIDSFGGSLWLILVVAALVSMVLGMGMPTSGVYVLLAALIAPSIVEAGVDPLAAHLFILYFGMMSMITPPVALAAIAAASISKANAFETGMASMKIGWASYVIPFAFVASPALLMHGAWQDTALAIGLMVAGITVITAGIVGYLGTPMSAGARALLIGVGLLAMPLLPNHSVWFVVNQVSALVVIVGLCLLWIRSRSNSFAEKQ